jgi:hypothetical protein
MSRPVHLSIEASSGSAILGASQIVNIYEQSSIADQLPVIRKGLRAGKKYSRRLIVFLTMNRVTLR